VSQATFSRRSLLLSAFPPLLLRGQDTTFSTDVKVVNVLATVRNKQGQIIKNLTKDDFVLEEDGRPQTIKYFSRETGLPLTLGLLVDTSGSQRQVLGQERSASARFIDQVIREDKDMAFVIHFDFETELLQDLTASRKKLRQAIQNVEPPQLQRRQQGGGGQGRRGGGGGTVLYDAALLASDELMRNQAGRKALIILSDGVDTGSKVSVNEAIESAQRTETLIYSILFYDDQAYGQQSGPMLGGRRRGGPPMRIPVQSHPDGKKILQRMSRETGGGFFEVSKKVPIEETFERIQEELRSQYSIGFTSDTPNAGSGFRSIRLTTTQKNMIVQTRDRYYAAQ
jgi:VWFA-related protein